MRIIALVMATVVPVLVSGCPERHSEVPMPFQPPLDRLTEVDSAPCEYVPGLVEIEGIVSPGSGGGWLTDRGYSVNAITFLSWRRNRGPLIRKVLLILRPVEPDRGRW